MLWDNVAKKGIMTLLLMKDMLSINMVGKTQEKNSSYLGMGECPRTALMTPGDPTVPIRPASVALS